MILPTMSEHHIDQFHFLNYFNSYFLIHFWSFTQKGIFFSLLNTVLKNDENAAIHKWRIFFDKLLYEIYGQYFKSP